MITLITGSVGSGKSTKLFEMVEESSKTKYTAVLTNEYDHQYVREHTPKADHKQLRVYVLPHDGVMSIITSLVLSGDYQSVFIDCGMHDIRALKLLDSLAVYAGVEIVSTMQTNMIGKGGRLVEVVAYGE